jgi:hypothetical protein
MVDFINDADSTRGDIDLAHGWLESLAVMNHPCRVDNHAIEVCKIINECQTSMNP